MQEELKKRLLAELLKNSRRSDRELARALGSSQPTITRTRQKIEREGLIRSYTIIPDWRKLGFEIMAFTFTKMRPEIRSEELFANAQKLALFRMDWGKYMENIQSFVIVPGEGEIKEFSFAYLTHALLS